LFAFQLCALCARLRVSVLDLFPDSFPLSRLLYEHDLFQQMFPVPSSFPFPHPLLLESAVSTPFNVPHPFLRAFPYLFTPRICAENFLYNQVELRYFLFFVLSSFPYYRVTRIRSRTLCASRSSHSPRFENYSPPA